MGLGETPSTWSLGLGRADQEAGSIFLGLASTTTPHFLGSQIRPLKCNGCHEAADCSREDRLACQAKGRGGSRVRALLRGFQGSPGMWLNTTFHQTQNNFPKLGSLRGLSTNNPSVGD